MKRTVLALLAALAVLAPAAAQARIVNAYGIRIQSCVVNSNGYGQTNGINVVYYNSAHPSPAVEIDFLIRYRSHRAILVDRGTFSETAQINHDLRNALVGYAWDGPNPNLCQVQRVVLANGRVLGGP
jgi:hypothetical protein